MSTTHAPDWVPTFTTRLEDAGYVDLAIAGLEAKEAAEAVQREVLDRILAVHDRAFWAMLRRFSPWLPPFEEAFPHGVDGSTAPVEAGDVA